MDELGKDGARRAAIAMATAAMVAAACSHATAGEAALAGEAEQAVARILSLDGDPAYGEYLGGECVTCHRQSGQSSGIPRINGLDVEYTVRALVEYRLGIRSNDVMKLMTARLADDEIAALAVYFSNDAAD